MEEFLSTLLAQIRCKKAHDAIREEIQVHIEEQTAANIANGMSKTEAEKAAVLDMGNPVEIGVSLDRIHRPKMAWEIIGIIAFITIAAMLFHGTRQFAFYAVIGFALMILVYFLDYTFVARFAKIIAALILAVPMYTMVSTGNLFYIYIGQFYISIFAFLMLYVPVFAAIVYKYYGKGFIGLAGALVWMCLPIVVALQIPSVSLALILIVSLLIVLTVAIVRDWFTVPKVRTIAFLWGIFPTVIAGYGLASRTYVRTRMLSFFAENGDASYERRTLHDYLQASKFVGKSESAAGFPKALPDYNGDLVFTYIAVRLGIVAAVIVCALLVYLAVRAFRISAKQKNQLGMLMGTASATVLTVNIAVNVLENVGLLPRSQTFLPFLSVGGSCMLVSYILIGVILSVYRYKDVHAKHVKVSIPVRLEL